MRLKLALLAVAGVAALCFTLNALAVPATLRPANATPMLAQAAPAADAATTPEELAARIESRAEGWFMANVWPWLVKLALLVGVARLLLKPIVEGIRAYRAAEITLNWRSVLNWLLSINTHPIRALMLCGLLAGSMLLTGCGSTKNLDVNDVATVAELAAFDGTVLHLTDNPQDRAKFEQALAAITVLSSGTNISAGQLTTALQDVKALKGPRGSLIVGNALILYNKLGQRMTLDTEKLRPITQALQRGLTSGLAAVPAAAK